MSFAGHTTRYTAYCTARGYATPVAQKDADGNMAGFICWIAAAWTAFGIPAGQRQLHHAAFDRWLPNFTQVTSLSIEPLQQARLRIAPVAGQGVKNLDKSGAVAHGTDSFLFPFFGDGT